MQITICGGGNAGHTLAGLLSARRTNAVHVYLPYGDEAQRWQEAIAEQGSLRVRRQHGPSGESLLQGKPLQISADPAEVIPHSQLVILALPAFAHGSTLSEIAPYLKPGAWVGAMPARGGFQQCAQQALGDRLADLTLFGLQTLPWACRIQEYGREVVILGTKAEVGLAVSPATRAIDVAQVLHWLLDLPVRLVSTFLALTLSDTGQIIHPGIMYGLFADWDGASFDQPPLFYQGVDESTAQILQGISDEIQNLRHLLELQLPDLDLSAVHPLKEWLLRSYPGSIEDEGSLRSCFLSNRSYTGLTVPTRPTPDGRCLPDFSARYLSEDIPYNLLVTRGIAELAGLDVPTMDKVITWAQTQLNKDYLCDGHLTGRDLNLSRAPQRYGIKSLQEMLW